MKRFSSLGRVNSAVKAAQLFPMLMALAGNQQLESYKQAAERIGYPDARPMGTILGYILAYCVRHDLPCLSRLLISKKTGEPGMEEVKMFNLWKVFEYEWDDIIPPSAEDLMSARQWVEEEQDRGLSWKGIIFRNSSKMMLV
jgi:hypothetical protein